MWFASYESRQRSADFQTMIACTAEALQHPDVVQRLGGAANELAEINRNAYLPNVRHGRAIVPADYQHEAGRVALLPITELEARGVQWLVAGFEGTLGPTTSFPDQVYSVPYGRVITAAEIMEELIEQRLSPSARGLSGWARRLEGLQGVAANCGKVRIQSDPSEYATSAPIIVCKRSLLDKTDRPTTAAVIGHEYGHHLTRRRDGVVQNTPTGAASTELFAYSTSDAICALSPAPSVYKDLAAEVEALRIANTTPDHPYSANRTVVSTLSARQLIHY
jgi:hypothetical protein